MVAYVQLGEVHTWYDQHGDGEPLVLLHPAAADARAFNPNLEALAARFKVFTPERRGHGRTPDVEGPITFELMAQDTIAFIERRVHEPAHLVGMSDGATVALYVAVRRPDLVRRLVAVGGAAHRDGWLPGAADLDEASAAFLASGYGEVSPDGVEHFGVVAEKVARMHEIEPDLTPEDLATVRNRAMVMVGDDDEVRLEHALEMYRAFPDSELTVVPGTSHGLLVEKPALCNSIIVEFLATEPVPTLAPIRRASTAEA